MSFIHWLFGRKENKNQTLDLDFEVFKSVGKDEYKKIKAEDGKLKQELEDVKMQRRLRDEAYAQFQSWRDGTIYIGLDPSIYGGIYYIHNQEASKWDNTKVRDEYRSKIYNELCEKAIEEVEDWQIKGLTKETVNDWFKTYRVYNSVELEAFRRRNGLTYKTI